MVRRSARGAVANAEVSNNIKRLNRPRFDPGNWDVEIAPDQADQQGQKGQMRRKAQGLKDIVNYSDLDKSEEKGQPKKEQNGVQKEKWAKKHGRNDTTICRQRHRSSKISHPHQVKFG
jgi:hypothetical protein